MPRTLRAGQRAQLFVIDVARVNAGSFTSRGPSSSRPRTGLVFRTPHRVRKLLGGQGRVLIS
jgi:hypothetical protein